MRMISLFHTLVFIATVLTFSMPFVAFAQQNTLQAEAKADAEKDAAINVDTDRWFWRGCFGGVSALTHVYEPSPPASRLIGKSPEYIAYYTDAYKAKATELQSSAVTKGCTTAGAVYVGISLIGIIMIATLTILVIAHLVVTHLIVHYASGFRWQLGLLTGVSFTCKEWVCTKVFPPTTTARSDFALKSNAYILTNCYSKRRTNLMKKMTFFTLILLVLSTISLQTAFAQVTLEGHTSDVTSVSFSPDGTTLASGSLDNTVMLWDMATKENIATLEGHTDWVWSVSFSPDGTTLASASWDNTVKLWDMATKENIATLGGHTGSVFSVSFSPDGTLLASGSEDGTMKLWDVGDSHTYRHT